MKYSAIIQTHGDVLGFDGDIRAWMASRIDYVKAKNNKRKQS